MKKNYLKILFLFTIFLCSSVLTTRADAYTITLDGVENAGWWEEDLSSAYLYIYDENGVLVWSSSSSELDWADFDTLIDDLSDSYLGDYGSGTWIGNYTIESGGDIFNTPDNVIYESLYLAAGWYTISLADDVDYSAYNLVGYWSEDAWNAYVQIFGGADYAYGDGNLSFASEEAAESWYNLYYSNLLIYVAADSWLYFYINDDNSLDNIGSVTLNIESVSVPEPATLLLFGSGIAALAARRRYKKKRG